MNEKMQKTLLVVLAVLLLISLFLNGWLLSSSKENMVSPENVWLPDGSYKASCGNCNFNVNILSCLCQARDSQIWRDASVDLNRPPCINRLDIENNDGYLLCIGEMVI